ATTKSPMERVVRVVVSSAPSPPRPRTLPERGTTTTAPPWTPSRCCRAWPRNSTTTFTCAETGGEGACPVASPAPPAITRATSGAIRRRVARPPAPALARDLRLFRQPVPLRLPVGHGEAGRLREPAHLASEGLADLVVVAGLEPVLA